MSKLPYILNKIASSQKKNLNPRQKKGLLLVLVLLISIIYPFAFPPKIDATALAVGYFLPDRMLDNIATGGDVCFNPYQTESSNVGGIQITFPGTGTQGAASYGVNSTAANWTYDTSASNLPAGATAFPGTATTSVVSGATVSFKVTTGQTLTTGNTYCLHFTGTSTLTNPSSANGSLIGSIELLNTSGTLLNSNEQLSYATADISNDQLAVSASVSQIFTFSLTAGSHALGTLSTSSVSSSPSTSTGTVATNALNGYDVWVKSANGDLLSPSTAATITAGTFASGSNIVNLTSNTGYVLDCQNSTNSPCNSNFLGNGTTSGGKLPLSWQILASSSSATPSDSFTLAARAKISTTQTPASDYADTITVSAAGQF